MSVQERNCRLEILENYFLKAVDIQCADILERHCQYLVSLHTNHASTSEEASAEKSHLKSKGYKHAYSFAQGNSLCKQCGSSEHHILQCTQFKELKINKSFGLVKKT